jgi:V/A-type H+-transporting ATPase subunit I
LRPVPARWFELLVLREDLSAAMDVLARSSRIELESHGKPSAPLLMPEYLELLEEFDVLERRYGRFWPAARAHDPDEHVEPNVMLQSGMRRVRAWVRNARGLVDELEELAHQQAQLILLQSMISDAGQLPALGRFARSGPLLSTCLCVLPGGEWPRSVPGSVITQRVTTQRHTFLLAVGLPADIAALGRQLGLMKARMVDLPPDLPGTAAEVKEEVRARLAEIEKRVDAGTRDMQYLHERHDLSDALADVQFVRWYVENVPDLESSENFAWITGWTSEADGKLLLELLAAADVKSLLRLTEAPRGYEPPLLLSNPRWMRPFEVFTGMMGIPAVTEADPTRIVAVASPLMFGYMFGDVGQGAVLLVAGIAFSRRFPALRLLIAGGAMSIVFGFLFGSVFALESVLHPWWMHPLDNPVLILLLPMAGGAALLLTGMCLEAVQAYWQRRAGEWWETGAGLMLCYLSLLGVLLEQRLLWFSLIGAAWFILGHALTSQGRRLAAVGAAAAEFLELALQLIVNTISFVRVGAFALAHAGLSLAVVGVSETPSSFVATLVILVLGNVLIIGLEGLVVAIQTTRLVLFEFFVRFLRAEGRPFRPISPPDSLPASDHGGPR